MNKTEILYLKANNYFLLIEQDNIYFHCLCDQMMTFTCQCIRNSDVGIFLCNKRRNTTDGVKGFGRLSNLDRVCS